MTTIERSKNVFNLYKAYDRGKHCRHLIFLRLTISAYAPNLAESTLALNFDIDFILRISSSMLFHILGNQCSWHERSVCGTIIIVDNMNMQDLSDGYIWLISWCNIQYKSRLSSYAKRIWFLANAFAPVLRNTQTHFELF